MTDSDNNGGNTPLHDAALAGDAETVRALAAAGADVDAKNEDGNTPLHVATREEHTETARVLVALGADVDTKIRTATRRCTWLLPPGIRGWHCLWLSQARTYMLWIATAKRRCIEQLAGCVRRRFGCLLD